MSELDWVETMRRIALDVNHALMVLTPPTDGQGKRAWASLLDAKEVSEAAIDQAEKKARAR